MTTGVPFWQPKKPKEPKPDVSQYWRIKPYQPYPPSKKLIEWEFIPTPVTPQVSPEWAMIQAGEAQRRAFRKWEERGVPEANKRKNLISQINWYEERLEPMYSPLIKKTDPETGDVTITNTTEELQSYLETLQRYEGGQVGGQAQQLTERQQRAQEIERSQRESAERQQQQTMESRALAKEFPEWFARYTGQPTPTGGGQTIAESQARMAAHRAVGEAQLATGQWRKTAYQARQAYEAATTPAEKQAAGYPAAGRMLAGAEATQTAATKAWQRAGGGGAPRPAPQDIFGQWFKPRQEELIQEWKVEQLREYGEIYRWFEEAGGWGTGKSFQEWIKSEPLAMGYLAEERATEAMRRPPQISRQWQPARR